LASIIAPSLTLIVDTLLAQAPGHERFLKQRFTDVPAREEQLLTRLSDRIVAIAGKELVRYCADYDWLTRMLLDEELAFRRSRRYRYTTLAEVEQHVYGDDEFMARYMNGLLLTQILWSNHTRAFAFYLDRFLGPAEQGRRMLEIGPGHGLLLAAAAESGRCSEVHGWDISAASLAGTRKALAAIGTTAELSQKGFTSSDQTGETFDLIALSEVLEHLEHPEDALRKLTRLLRPGGRIFIQVPVNSPAPDHLLLLRSPEEAVSFVSGHGFTVIEREFFPATNTTLDEARRLALTISISMICRRST
jgi:2-polyprenyl-3-methyl-5-hydroxy-6-metoxy-1,4-benzoquinol methylase